MKVIEYSLDPCDVQSVSIPIGSKVLSVKEQNGGLVMWVLAEKEVPYTSVLVRMVETDRSVGGLEDFSYLDTVVMSYGGFVWHVFVKGLVF